MGSRVLLISINRCEDPYPVFPLGLTYVDCALLEAGFETAWFDCIVDRNLAKVVERFAPDFIGISLRNIDDVVIKRRETFYGALISTCATLRQLTKAPIILGGSGFSIFPEQLMQLSDADYGICGESETAFPALLKALNENRPCHSIPGLVFRRAGEIVRNAPVVNSRAMSSSAPRPEPLRVSEYYLQSSSMLNVQTQRGCAQHCCYCTYPLLEGRHHRYRPATDVADELQQLETRGAKYVFVVDSVFNSSPQHVVRVCEEIIARNIKMRWACFLRPAGLTDDLMRLMARAGLTHIEFGSDSFCDSVLQAYGKRFTFDDIAESSELAHKHKVEFCHFLVCGGPGETRETLQRSFENSLRIRQNLSLALVGMRIYPATPLHDRARSEGVIRADTDLLEPQYYLAPSLTEDVIFDRLREFRKRDPSWIVGEASAPYIAMTKRLREKGMVGPTWSYFAVMQRLGL